MERPTTRRRTIGAWPLVLVLLAACSRETPVERLPSARATLASAGKRLAETLSTGDLTDLAAHGDRVLARLDARERDVLARGYLRFRIDCPADVFVAYPRGHAPFWLDDQGFAPSPLAVDTEAGPWDVLCKAFPAGWVGLGVNGLDRSTPAHYAVFLVGRDGRNLSVEAPDGWRSTLAANGLPIDLLGDSPIRSLPTPLKDATLLRAAHDRRHDTILARGRVWKTHVVAHARPDQITVAFGLDASRDLAWTWRTDAATKATVVRIRSAGESREVYGTSEPIAIPDLLNDPVVNRHVVRVTGLAPATSYEYSVGDGTAAGMSDWHAVKTAEPPGKDVALMYMGDPQCGLEGWGKLLASAVKRRPDTDAILIAGDLVDRGNERTNWDHFFLRAAGVFERFPLMPAVGNHEYLDRGPWLYRANFALPENGPAGVDADLAYHFEIGDAFVAVLDSTLASSDPDSARRQADWLDARLAETSRPWKLVMFHHPVYASHPTRENLALRDAWTPILDRHRVDLVLQGHDHAYLRTYPMRGQKRRSSPAEGTVYVVAVSGDKYCDVDGRGYGEIGFAEVSTYQMIDIKPRENRLVYKAFDASGRERDGFEIVKARPVARVAARQGGL